jgi:hypothetical protein
LTIYLHKTNSYKSHAREVFPGAWNIFQGGWLCIWALATMSENHRLSLDSILRAIDLEERVPSPLSRPRSASPQLSSSRESQANVIPITQLDVNTVLLQARAFYKTGWKSENKVYDPKQLADLGILEEDKHRNRNSNAIQAKENVASLRATPITPDAAYGQHIVETDQSAGNCGEMCAVVAYYAQALATWRQGVCNIYICKVLPPGNHSFVVLSGNGSMPNHHRLAQTSSVIGRNFWAIDCWMNIACPLNQYLPNAMTKMNQWARQGKGITSRDPELRRDIVYNLRDGRYQNYMMQSGVRHFLATH